MLDIILPMTRYIYLFAFILFGFSNLNAQHSVARIWNEALLQSIREDFARPPIHARNLWHTSLAMYDAWAAYDNVASTYFLGKTVHGYTCPYTGTVIPEDIEAAREEAISFAAYRVLSHRFKISPGAAAAQVRFDSIMTSLGYDYNNISLDYSNSPAGLGNYIGTFIINYGFQDGSNEAGNYKNQYYKPVNPPIAPELPGNPDIKDPNRWQQLYLNVQIDQSGHIISGNTQPFLNPEWGLVHPFSLDTSDLQILHRDSNDYWVYHLSDLPPFLDTVNVGGESEEYKWGFELVSKWSAHLDATDTTTLDISPASLGNVLEYPTTWSEYHNFYQKEGGDPGKGYAENPITMQPYQPQIVRRGDYARVLAEFWADGPDSETPPGHWFTILNYVADHPLSHHDFKGEKPLTDLEWDVKAYFVLGGTMHDVAISSWGIKGYVDYIRPVSAIRYMADLGQSSSQMKPNYHPGGIRLDPGLIELVMPGDPLEGPMGENINKIKVFAWKGHDYITDPKTDVAGVDWILAENWWPYQRPSFVTPPFAGFVSGHSTYSRAAAQVLALFTGDEYFPGGLGQFFAKKNEFLVFEEGPSQHVTLQWAKYKDASDQCSLSRIWGGIHPPADDIPGRFIGKEIADNAFALAEHYFYTYYNDVPENEKVNNSIKVYPNPVDGDYFTIQGERLKSLNALKLYSLQGQEIHTELNTFGVNQLRCSFNDASKGFYILKLVGEGWNESHKIQIN